MVKKRVFAGGGSLSDKAKKAGVELGKTTSFGKFLGSKIDEADTLTSRMKILREKGPEELAKVDRARGALSDTAEAERKKAMDSMGSYKKGGAVRGDGIAQRGRTKGRFI